MSRFIFPGTFDPPTYGHADIARRAYQAFGNLDVVCSHNEDKTGTRWFGAKKCVELWKSYGLDPSIRIRTFEDQVSQPGPKTDKYVIVRGLRNANDFTHEASVIEKNLKLFGIDTYGYVTARPEYHDISSTSARKSAGELDLEGLSRTVSPMVVTELLKHRLQAESVKIVVGPPGGGKSTFLRFLVKSDPRNIVIHTDDFNEELAEILRLHFKTDDIVPILVNYDKEVSDLLRSPWLQKVSEALKAIPPGSRIFIETAFGLGEHKSVFKYLGADILYIGCNVGRDVERRLEARGTPHLIPLIGLIPDFTKSEQIARDNHLSISSIPTDGTLEHLVQLAEAYATSLDAKMSWKSSRK